MRVVHLEQKGRGRALRTVWQESDAAVLAYMDVDLSTDLAAVLPLIAPLVSGHSDLAIGTRLHRGSRVTRGAKREVISRSYNVLLRRTLSARFSDAQCGFKAIRREVAAALLPHVHDNGGSSTPSSSSSPSAPACASTRCRSTGSTTRTPASRSSTPPSRISAASCVSSAPSLAARSPCTTSPRSSAVARSSSGGRPPGLLRQVVRFGAVGVLSTAAFAVLFVLLARPARPQAANAMSLLITAIGNTQLNRRFTFAVKGSRHLAQHQLQGLIVFAIALGITSGSLALAARQLG